MGNERMEDDRRRLGASEEGIATWMLHRELAWQALKATKSDRTALAQRVSEMYKWERATEIIK